MSQAEAYAVNGYLNPGHGSNCADAVALPDGRPGRRYLLRNYQELVVNCANPNPGAAHAATSKLVFACLPFAEAPFGYHDGTQWVAIYPNTMLSGAVVNPGIFMHNSGVYKYRCVGKSMTIKETSALQYRTGAVTVCRKTSDVDSSNLQDSAQGATADAVNFRIMQQMPTTTAEASLLTGNASTWNPSEGAYLIAHHEDHEWVVRDRWSNKAFINSVVNSTMQNTSLYTTTVAGAAPVRVVPAGYTDTCYTTVGPTDHMDIPIAVFDSLDSVNSKFVIKMTCVYELQLKAGSPLASQTEPSPPANQHLMDAMYDYESLTSGLYKAEANDLSDIWRGFKNFWKKGGGTAISTGLNLIEPGMGSIAGAVGDIFTNF